VNSLQKRLHLGLASSVVVLMLLLWWLISGAMEKFGEEFVRSRLEHDVDTLLSSMQLDEANRLQLTLGRISEIYQKPFSGHYYVVMTEDQTFYSRSLWDETLAAKPLAMGETRQWLTTGPNAQPLLVWSGGFKKQGRGLTITVAEDLSALRENIQRFNWYFAGLSLFVLLVLLAVQRYIVRRSLAPLEQIQQEIKKLQQGMQGELTESVPTEVQPLVREVNHLLRLLEDRLKRSRNALGNLAHALKTPLSLLSQLAQREALSASPELSASLKKHTATIQQLMDRELKRARLMGQGSPGARFVPQEEMPVLVDMLQRMWATDVARTTPLEIRWQAPDIAFMFDRDDMLELIGNLLDNACKWAKQEVRCVLQGDDRYLQLVVEDDGPGCNEEETRQMTQRGVRIDESEPGHGLGLSIVQDVVEIYDGSLSFDRSADLGGLQVSVTLENQTANMTNGS
jgi:signal transduction histidine kinase